MKLTPRDKKFLTIGGIFVLLFLFLQLGLFPLLDKRTRLREGIEARINAEQEMQKLQEQYRQLHAKANTLLDKLAGRQNDFSLFAYLEKMAASSDIKQNIGYMRPSETADEGPFKEIMVEMKLQAVSLKQLVDFLSQVESPDKVIAIQRISIQENKKEEATLDVIVQVVSLDRNPQQGGSRG